MSDPLIYTGLGAKELVTTTFPVDVGVTQDMVELGAAALGTRPAGWLIPDRVSVTDGVCVASVWVGNAHAINPPSGSYLLWRRVVDTDGQILIAESTDIRFVVVNDLGAPLPATPTYVTGLTSDDGSVVIGGTADMPDLSVSGGGSAVESVNGQTGVVELTAGDVGADTAAARDAAISAEASRAQSVEGGIELDLANEVTRAEAAESTNAAAVVTEATARASAITTEATARVAGDAVNATAITNEAARAISVEAAKADLVTGKVPTSQLPAMALFKITAVANQAAMLALPAGESYLVSRTDSSRRFMLDSAADPTVLGNWVLVDTDPSAAVDTVNGQTGTVVLAASDVGADTAAARDTAIGAETTRATAAEAANASAITAETTRATAGEAAAQAAAIAASQPVDSDLTAIAALSTTTYGRALLTLADAAALRTTAGLGTAATSNTTAFDAAGAAAAAQAASQPLDSDLTAIAALTTTSFGRSFLALADAAAGRTLLGLGTLATQSGTFSGTSSGTNSGDQTITLTGDATGSGTGSFAVALAASGVTAAAYGDATHVPTFTVDAKGRVTIAASVAIALPESAITGLTADLAAKVPTSRQVASGTGLSGGGDLSADRTLALANTAVSAGSYTNTSLTVDAQGRLTAASSGGAGAVAMTRQGKTGTYSAALGEMVCCDTTGGVFTVTLPAASGGKGRIVIKWTAGTLPPSVAMTGSDHINTSGGSTGGAFTLLNQAAQYESDGTSLWVITAEDLALSMLDARYATRPGFGLFANALVGSQRWHDFCGQSGVFAPTQSQLILAPMIVARSVSAINALGTQCTTAAASNVIRLGLYTISADGTTLTLLIDAGTASAAATGGLTLSISNTAIPVGTLYEASVLQGGAGAQFPGRRNTTSDGSSLTALGYGNDGTFGGSPIEQRPPGFTLGSVAGALPSTIAVSTLTQASLAPVFMAYRTATGWS